MKIEQQVWSQISSKTWSTLRLDLVNIVNKKSSNSTREVFANNMESPKLAVLRYSYQTILKYNTDE